MIAKSKLNSTETKISEAIINNELVVKTYSITRLIRKKDKRIMYKNNVILLLKV